MINNAGLTSLDTPEDETPSAGATVKATPKGVSPVGDIAMNPKQTAELLANMEDMVNERSGAFNTFLGGLKDATAWGSGGVEGPSRALALREADKAKEYKDVYDMRTQMAAYRAAQAQQEAYNEEQKRIFGGGKGAGAGGTSVPGGGTMYKGVMLDPETAVAMGQARSREDRDKIFNDFASKRSQARGSFEYGAPTYKNDIKFVTPEGKLQYIDAATAKRYKDEGYGEVLGPSTTQGYRPTAAGGVPPEAIKQVESGGRPGLVSSAGAEGTMQVMPNTQTDPGYGVTPARDKSQAELERVGRDYYAAMQKQYGNDTLASVAYNMGPGRTDEWLKKGGNFKDLPAETRDYIGQVHLATAKLNRASAEVAPRPQAGGAAPNQRLTIPEAEAAAAGQKTRAEAQGTAAGKYLGGAEATVREAGNTSGERLSSLDYLEGLVNNPKTSRVFGVFEHPDFASAIGKIVDNGIKLGRLGDVGVDLAPIVRTVMKDASPEEIDAVQKATREFAKIKLNEAKILLAGQGAVSDAERGLVQELSGSIKNSPGALKDYLAWGKMRAQYDRDVGEAFKTFRRTNRGASFEDFLDTGKADDLRDAYDSKLIDFAKKTGIDMTKAVSNANTAQQQPKTSPMTYSDSDKEKRYQLYKQQNPGTK